ncbi:MAG: class I SAM-dependent methyltransferase [Methanobacteriota archaeon]
MGSSTSSSEHEHYLSKAAAYDTRIDAILPMSDLFFSSCLSFIPDGPVTLLELGSGTGYATSKILTVHPQAAVTCIDHSPEMIACALQKPELQSVQILEQDIRDPWPDKQYDVIMTTLCFHHIPGDDRIVLLHRAYETLPSGGIFICGDIVRPEYAKAEEIYSARWIRTMKQAGLPPADIEQIIHSRKENYGEMETIERFIRKIHDIGFSEVLMPYRHEISAVFVGIK